MLFTGTLANFIWAGQTKFLGPVQQASPTLMGITLVRHIHL